ncbi:MAG: sigma-70 family RNA polymerase sigma factor [Planctomycetota bacterium]|nr:sigma-70 family RNA polymerase sigma factor [Planctomycetota bacterium]
MKPRSNNDAAPRGTGSPRDERVATRASRTGAKDADQKQAGNVGELRWTGAVDSPPEDQQAETEAGQSAAEGKGMPTEAGLDLDATRETNPGAEADKALLNRLRQGDDAAFAEWVERDAGRMRAVALRVVRSEADADDVVQEAFFAAFRALSKFDGRSSLSTWLHRITVNAGLMRLRKKRGRAEASIEALLPRFEGGYHEQAPRAWRAVTPEEASSIGKRGVVWQALDRLPDDYRTVVVLRDVEGMESKEVAASLGISDELVRQRLHRGRQALVKLLEPAMRADSEDTANPNGLQLDSGGVALKTPQAKGARSKQAGTREAGDPGRAGGADGGGQGVRGKGERQDGQRRGHTRARKEQDP